MKYLVALCSLAAIGAAAQVAVVSPPASSPATPPGPAAGSAAVLNTVRSFVRDVYSAQADFVQSVISPKNKKIRVSKGTLAFVRPDHFRFTYTQPYEQTIVGDGSTVWIYEADLNQVTVRPMSQALSATPAALLSGRGLDKEFELTAQPSADGLQWVRAVPRNKEGQFQSMLIGFMGPNLARLEVVDSFGQISKLQFANFKSNVTLPTSTFEFNPPAGAEVIRQ